MYKPCGDILKLVVVVAAAVVHTSEWEREIKQKKSALLLSQGYIQW